MNGKEGKIYILRNPYIKDAIIKIGRTSRISEKRAKEISGVTGVPYEFEVLFEEDVLDSHLAERLIHEKLDDNRVNPKREFFQMPLKKAVKVVFETCLEVNKKLLREASTRIVIAVGPDQSKNFVQQMAEVLSQHKGGKIGVYILIETEKAKLVLKIGEEWDVSLSPVLINELKRLRGVTDVLWASSAL